PGTERSALRGGEPARPPGPGAPRGPAGPPPARGEVPPRAADARRVVRPRVGRDRPRARRGRGRPRSPLAEPGAARPGAGRRRARGLARRVPRRAGAELRPHDTEPTLALGPPRPGAGAL